MSPLRREYLLWEGNVLTNNVKISLVNKREFSNSSNSTVINKDGKIDAVDIKAVFRGVYHVACRRFNLKRDFLEIYLITSLAVRDFGNT